MKYFLIKGHIVQKLDNKINIVDGEKSILHTLNDTGSFIFEYIRRGLDHKKIVSQVAKKYKISEKEAEEDLEKFIITLKKKKIIV